MKVKKYVVLALVMSICIGLGIWLGIDLTKQNSVVTTAVSIFAGDEQNAIVLLNKKNKVLHVDMQTTTNQKIDSKKYLGLSLQDFVNKFFVESDTKDDVINIEIYGSNHQKNVNIKNELEKHISKKYGKNDAKIEQKYSIFSQNTGIKQKYAKLLDKKISNQKDDLTERFALQSLKKTQKK